MTVFYFGGYLDEGIVKERGLRTFNAAGSNRMVRLSHAIRCRRKLCIVSQAVSLRQRFRGKLFHPARVRRNSGVAVLFLPSLGIPFVGSLVAPVFLLWVWFFRLRGRMRNDPAIIYNYNFSFLLLAVAIRVLGKRFIHNVEDVADPRLVDILPGSEASFMQQVPHFFCMKSINRMSEGAILPTNRFRATLSTQDNLIVTGCMDVRDVVPARNSDGIFSILYAGKIEFEHGAQIVAEACRALEKKGYADRIRLVVCGEDGPAHQWLRSELADRAWVEFKGFLSSSDYRYELGKANVCLVLQNDKGRFADIRVPSKIYEYIANGKLVIATRCGDFDKMEGEFARFIDFDSKELSESLEEMVEQSNGSSERENEAFLYAKSNWSFNIVGSAIDRFMSDVERN